MNEDYIEILAKTPLFKGIDKSDISYMVGCIKPKVKSYDRNEQIAVSGMALSGIGIILKGEATVSKENAEGNRVIMTVLHEGDIFGEMIAFSGQKTWPASVQAQEDCIVFFLPNDKIVGECEKMCPWHRSLIRNLLCVISERALMLNKKVEYLTIKSMRGKIGTYLLEQYKKTGKRDITLPLNRNELADFLNVSRPSMSREICKMRDEGLIDFHMTAFRILDVEALKAMSVL
jgi:cAMP-binding proteins - catabolite gene activator and regulatory subunit of cAMP-dependent protein kinases